VQVVRPQRAVHGTIRTAEVASQREQWNWQRRLHESTPASGLPPLRPSTCRSLLPIPAGIEAVGSPTGATAFALIGGDLDATRKYVAERENG
jgi:hypothetical protein